MEENQTNQNLNQQPVQPVQPQPEQIQQSVQGQPVQNQQQVQQQSVQGQVQPVQSVQEPTVSMQIQQLLVQQQQYQQQYNQLVDYVKKTPNLPIEQVNQIKAQLDQLNALFVEGKQKLQSLGYTQVQVQKPTEVKKGPRNNFSFKKLAIGCGIVLILIFTGFFLTLTSLIKNPDALQGIGVNASVAKTLLMAFSALLFGSIIILMLGVIVANIYRLITVKNQSKWKYIWGLIGGLIGAAGVGVVMGIVFGWIGKIVTEIEEKDYDIIQPYLVGRVEEALIDEFAHPYNGENMEGIGKNYPLIAPSEIAFSIRWDELIKLTNKELPAGYEIVNIKFLCGNKDSTVLEVFDTEGVNRRFNGTCLYSDKGTYTYGIELTYDNTITKERKTIKYDLKSLDFKSDITVYSTNTTSSSSNSTTTKLSSSNGEFILGKAPAKITVDTTQIFRDFGLPSYKSEWDMNGDFVNDRSDIVSFDYFYNIPQIYYITYKFPELSDDVRYRFPVRVEPSDIPVCTLSLQNFTGTAKYHIISDFIDPSDAIKISSYNYTIKSIKSKNAYEVMKNQPQEINYTFPEEGTYVVLLDYVTVDGKQGRCESEPIQMKKETFDVQYSILAQNTESGKFKELCNSKDMSGGCKEVVLDTIPNTYQLQIKSVTPSTNTLKKVVKLNGNPLLNENDTYTFDIQNEGVYELNIIISDVGKGMDEEITNITFTAKKPDIVGNMTITSADTREPITEGFEPLKVILDVSKTEVNIPGDEIVYFTWDFGDGEIKNNQQNAIVSHIYTYDYKNENGIFQPKVTIHTLQQKTQEIIGPILNVKKGLVSLEITPTSHPSRQAKVGTEVTFLGEFDGLPEKMTWDFGDGTTPVTCGGRNCAEISHVFEKTGLFSIKLSLEFDAVQQVDGNIDFKVY